MPGSALDAGISISQSQPLPQRLRRTHQMHPRFSKMGERGVSRICVVHNTGHDHRRRAILQKVHPAHELRVQVTQTIEQMLHGPGDAVALGLTLLH